MEVVEVRVFQAVGHFKSDGEGVATMVGKVISIENLEISRLAYGAYVIGNGHDGTRSVGHERQGGRKAFWKKFRTIDPCPYENERGTRGNRVCIEHFGWCSHSNVGFNLPQTFDFVLQIHQSLVRFLKSLLLNFF